MKNIPLHGGRFSGQLLSYERTEDEGWVYTCRKSPSDLPTHLKIVVTTGRKNQPARNCISLHALTGEKLASYTQVRGVPLFVAESKKRAGFISILVIKPTPYFSALQVLYIAEVLGIHQRIAKRVSREYFVGKKKPSGERAVSDTGKAKRGFDNRSD